jgi:CBS domain-containing protein
LNEFRQPGNSKRKKKGCVVLKIRDIMTHRVAFVNPQTTVVEAAQLMQKHDVGAIPVCEGEKILGIVTDRDIVVRNIAHGKDPHSTPVREVMTTDVKSVTPEMNLSQAAGIMADQQIRRLPVLENERLVGMVSLGDLATKAKFDVEISQALGDISFPSEPEKL